MLPSFSFHCAASRALLLSFLVASAAAGVPVLPGGGTLVDLHCHTAGIGAGGSGCYTTPRLTRSVRFALYLRSFGVSRAELERHGDRVVVDRIAGQVAESRAVRQAVILALDGPVTPDGELDLSKTEVYVPNEFVAAEVAKHPELLFGASVNPLRPDALQRLEWAKAHGAVLVKWLPSIQDINPADPRLVAYYRKLAELQLPLLTHTGNERAFTHSNDALSDPERLRLPLSLDVTVIAAHAAANGRHEGEPAVERLARLMREYPNLYADVSSLTQLNKRNELRRIVARPEFRQRLVYGTDYPLIAIRTLVSPWYFPRLTWRQQRDIAATNNAWDRDVALKHALGVPEDVWSRGGKVLGFAPAGGAVSTP